MDDLIREASSAGVEGVEKFLACAAKARGARALVVQSAWPKFNVSALEDASYTKQWVAAGVKNLKNTTPWAALWLRSVPREAKGAVVMHIAAAAELEFRVRERCQRGGARSPTI